MKRLRSRYDFNWRSFASLTLFLGFLIMSVSGFILYISPRGRVANWSGWGILGLGKEEWGAVHIVSAVLLLVMAGLHLFFNWRIFIHYLKSRKLPGFQFKPELVASLAVTGLCLLGTVWEFPPFRNVVSLSTAMKDYWEERSPLAPVAHTEEMSVEKVAEQANLDPEVLVGRIRAAGYSVADSQTPFREVAESNQVSPSVLYETASIPFSESRGNRGQHSAGRSGRGFGRLTLDELCVQENLQVDQVIRKLETYGITATGKEPLKDLATQLEMSPFDILSVLKNESGEAPQG